MIIAMELWVTIGLHSNYCFRKTPGIKLLVTIKIVIKLLAREIFCYQIIGSDRVAFKLLLTSIIAMKLITGFFAIKLLITSGLHPNYCLRIILAIELLFTAVVCNRIIIIYEDQVGIIIYEILLHQIIYYAVSLLSNYYL